MSVDIPMGLGMALAQEPESLKYFANLPAAGQAKVIDRTHSIRSKQEMRQFVRDLAGS